MKYKTVVLELPIVQEPTGGVCRTPEDVARLCSDMADLAQETFVVLCLSAKNDCIDRCMVTLGTADSTLVHAREIFRTAIERNACSVVVVHNHASGDPASSAADIQITRRLVEAGKVLDIKVIDSIIIGRHLNGNGKAFVSMREDKLCSFE